MVILYIALVHFLEEDRAQSLEDKAQSLVEYALILGLICLVAITPLTLLGINVAALLNILLAALSGA